jgi:hypothetical protein
MRTRQYIIFNMKQNVRLETGETGETLAALGTLSRRVAVQNHMQFQIFLH